MCYRLRLRREKPSPTRQINPAASRDTVPGSGAERAGAGANPGKVSLVTPSERPMKPVVKEVALVFTISISDVPVLTAGKKLNETTPGDMLKALAGAMVPTPRPDGGKPTVPSL